jgi:hypothetical protein
MTKSPVTLLILGFLSVSLGPITGVPGIIMGKRMLNRGTLGDLGYFLCWTFTVILGAAAIIGFIAAVTLPLWRP